MNSSAKVNITLDFSLKWMRGVSLTQSSSRHVVGMHRDLSAASRKRSMRPRHCALRRPVFRLEKLCNTTETSITAPFPSPPSNFPS
ncbi:jg9681 [Pararge aegeria aegeria]|uniref:Jg9681 protein n=1 Tax=Pararge aegeria aegeria TaxID=348720 RepID=A0A8S4RSU9_9NEOP|nr:jg9681 [Pararge aegeria aegeria]